MMITNPLKGIFLPALVGGLIAAGGAAAQVVEERPAGQTSRPGAIQEDRGNTAILTDADRTQADQSGDAIRRVSEILSGEARGQGDEGRIAAISDLIMDGEGRPHYVLLSRGGVAGLGGEKIAVPFDAAPLTYVEDGGWRIELPMTGEQLDQAPKLEEGSLAPLRDQNWVRTNREFFRAAGAGGPEGTGDDSLLFRASALKDAQVRGTAGDDTIANVDDVLLGPDFQATYAILGYGGVAGLGKSEVPVPFRMLRLTSEADNDHYRLVVGVDTTKERLQADTAPKLEGDYNRMLDPTFTERVESYFGADATGTAPTTPGTTGTPGTLETPGTTEPRPRP